MYTIEQNGAEGKGRGDGEQRRVYRAGKRGDQGRGKREREGARKHLIKICKDQTSRPMMLTRKK